MDVNEVRNRLITGFKPKEKDLDTPYLGDLNGELKLVGITGKQRIDLEDQASNEVLDKEGKATSKLNSKKFIALALAQCLRLRSTGEPIFSAADVLGESGDGDGIAAEMGSEEYLQLIKQVGDFIGVKSKEDTKKNLPQTNGGSDSLSSQPALDAPLTNSLEASTVQS